jgi:arylsulfatase A-like enzyme
MKRLSRVGSLPVRTASLAVAGWMLAVSASHVFAESGPPRQPNVVLVMTDNHGAWSLGCYGSPDVRTPNIDRLAREGILFTRCFSSNAVCSPTRATFLTGLIPSQHGVHDFLRAGGWQIGPKAHSTIHEFRTLPEILAEAGFACGLSGKWHLGDNVRPQEGFGFWVTKPHGGTSTLYRTPVIEDGQVTSVSGYATEYWTRRGIEFIEENKDRPFFLLLTYNGPYGHGARPAHNRHVDYYADKPMDSFPREPVHPWLKVDRKLVGNVDAYRAYAAEVSGIDDGVGEILRTLEKNELDQDTLVIFTADQGFACGHGGFWGMGWHTEPKTGFDWTMHIPMIWRHPKGIPAGRESDVLTSNYDLMVTLLSYLGLKGKIAAKPQSPGRDYAPLVRGQKLGPWDNAVFYDFLSVRAIRTAQWKYIERNGGEFPRELYNLKTDPGERDNLADQPLYAETQSELRQRLQAFFDRYAEPKYDLWRGGKSKHEPDFPFPKRREQDG